MKHLRNLYLAVLLSAALLLNACAREGDDYVTAEDVADSFPLEAQTVDGNPQQAAETNMTAVFYTTAGEIEVMLYPQEEPEAVERFKKQVEAGAYDGQQFVYVRRGGIIECDNVTDHATAEDAAEENAATEETAQSQESNDPDDYTEDELAAIELPATPENAVYPKYSDNLHHYYGSVGISEQKEQGGDRLHFVMDQSKPEDARLVPANLYMNELVNRGTAELQAYATTTPLTGKQLAAFVWRLNKQVAAIGTEGVPAAYADKYAAAAKTYDDVGGEWALDYKYTVIGQIVRGLNVAEGISQVKVTAADRKPKKDIVIDHVEILEK